MKRLSTPLLALFAASALAASACGSAGETNSDDGTGGTSAGQGGGSGGTTSNGVGGSGTGGDATGGGGGGGTTGLEPTFAKAFGGSEDSVGTAAGFDSEGNLYVAGAFDGDIDFGEGPVTTSGYQDFDVFLVKLDPSGNPIWSLTFGDAAHQQVDGLVVDSTGAVIITGEFGGTVDFGGGPVTAAGDADFFITKYDSSGAHEWTHTAGSSDNTQRGLDLVVDSNDDVFVCGLMTGDADFGGGDLTSAGSTDNFFVKYASDGTFLWHRRDGDSSAQNLCKLAVDGDDDLYVALALTGAIDFGGGTVTSKGARDILVLKLKGNDGDFAAQHGPYGDSEDSYAHFVQIKGGEIYLGGWFSGSIDFGGGKLTSNGGTDIFSVRLDLADDAKQLAVKHIGGPGYDYAFAQGVATNGDLAFGGDFDGVLNPGLGNMAAQSVDIFYARYAASDLAPVHQVGPIGDPDYQIINAGASNGKKIALLPQFEGSVTFGSTTLTSKAYTDMAVVVYDLE